MSCRIPPPKHLQDQKPECNLHVKTDAHGKTTPSQNDTEEKPKHVNSKLWEKFKALEKRTDEVTQRSTEKQMKHLRKKIVEKVEREITLDEDKDILRAHDVKFGPPVKPTASGHKTNGVDSIVEENSKSSKHWQDVKQYLNSDKNLQAGVSEPQSKLDIKIEEALAKGEYSSAEQLSDQLANREFGTKIAKAFDARDFVKRKKEEESEQNSRKKKKLNWGFEHKQRWEMKSNM